MSVVPPVCFTLMYVVMLVYLCREGGESPRAQGAGLEMREYAVRGPWSPRRIRVQS